VLDAVNILVVDDDKDVCILLEDALETAGYKVSAVNDPMLAAPTLKNGNFHLVILDLNMPGKSGLEVLEEIRAHDPEIAVIICTGFPSVETAAAAMRLGGTDYVQKPFNLDRFLTAVRNAIETRGIVIDPEEQLNRQIGERVRSIRAEKGLTQKQLAERARISKSQVSQIELGSSGASVSSLYRISEALSIRLGRIFEGL
jgi:DNA-binding NtrC family response regulator